MSSRLHVRPLMYSLVLLALLSLFAATLIASHQVAHADALWRIVHGRCVPDMQAHQNPAPCIRVDLPNGTDTLSSSPNSGTAILKDTTGNAQYLLLPTDRITGIESPALLAPQAPNYFADAWAATDLVDQRLHQTLPRADLALAINSLSGRTRNQLHIHIDCIQPAVKSALQQFGPQIGTTWQPLPIRLSGHVYRALWLPGAQLGPRNPFHLLADSLPDPSRDMAAHTLVLVGAERSGQPGFYLLDSEAPKFAAALAPWLKLGYASGEALEDHNCAIAHTPPS